MSGWMPHGLGDPFEGFRWRERGGWVVAEGDQDEAQFSVPAGIRVALTSFFDTRGLFSLPAGVSTHPLGAPSSRKSRTVSRLCQGKPGAAGAQPAIYMLGRQQGRAAKGKDVPSLRIRDASGRNQRPTVRFGCRLDRNQVRSNPFSRARREKNCRRTRLKRGMRKYLLKLMDLAAELGVKSLPMFWGVAFGWGSRLWLSWGFWQGDLTLVKERRFVKRPRNSTKRPMNAVSSCVMRSHPGTVPCAPMTSDAGPDL